LSDEEHYHGGVTFRELILSLHKGGVDAIGQHALAHALDGVLPRRFLDVDLLTFVDMGYERRNPVLTTQVKVEDHELLREKIRLEGKAH
jgi:hypothetical protein